MFKNSIYPVLILVSFLMIQSCAGAFYPLTYNQNQHSTQVHLTKNNYKVTKDVSGSASAKYILGFGGLKKTALVQEARSKMIKEAGLVGGSKAIINESLEMHQSIKFFAIKWTVTVSGQVIEFDGDDK